MKKTDEKNKTPSLLSQVLNTASDGMCLIGRDYSIFAINSSLADMLGLDREKVIGKKCYEVLGGPVCKTDRCSLDRIAAGERQIEYETEKRRGDGIRIPCLVVAKPFLNANGELVGIIGDLKDLTSIKESDNKLREKNEQLFKILESTIDAISRAIEMRDPYTAGHQKRVTALAVAIALRIGFSTDQIDGIRMAGLIHDIGKIAVPAEILVKPGQITQWEFALIEKHSQVGYDILKKVDFPWPVAKIVLQHHERINGSGYPQGLKGEDILPEARVIAVADVVESIASFRPYRPALGMEVALKEIDEQKGILYDAKVVRACQELIAEGRFGSDEWCADQPIPKSDELNIRSGKAVVMPSETADPASFNPNCSDEAFCGPAVRSDDLSLAQIELEGK